MANYIVRRALYAVLILIGVNLLTFTLFFAVNSPDNIARLNIGGKRVSTDAIEKWKAERGYDKPLWFNRDAEGVEKITKTIFYDRSLRLFTLDFGTSDSGREIQHEIGTRLLVSLTLAGPMLLLTVHSRHYVFAAARVFSRELSRLLGHRTVRRDDVDLESVLHHHGAVVLRQDAEAGAAVGFCARP